jgi:spermidine synthase/MFS family permease
MTGSRRTLALEIFLVSFAALLLEISYTRVFSFKVSSYYTYLIIGFALLGIGAGGVFVTLAARLRERPPERLLPLLSLAGGAVIGIGYLVIAGLELSTYEAPTAPASLAALALACSVLFASFLAIGLIIALIFSRRPEAIHRLYFADLAGAGMGCAAAVPLMLWLSPPGCVFASGAALAASGLRLASRTGRALALASVALAFLLAGVAIRVETLPDPVVDPVKMMSSAKLEASGSEPIFQRWHPVFRVDVLESPAFDGRLALLHDGDWGSALWRFDGELASLEAKHARSPLELPFTVAKSSPRVLVMGAAGGSEILASLYFGAEAVTAVELNPVTVSLLTDHFADYTGHLAEHDRVTLVNAEGRSFLRRDQGRYDLIWFVAPDSYAAMNAAQTSGFVLVESYLYTREMIREALRHLAPGGALCMQFGEVDYHSKPNRTARYLATARAAFADDGIRDFARHVLLATSAEFPLQVSTILLSATPFSEAGTHAFVSAAGALPDGKARHAFGRSADKGAPNAIISLRDEELAAFLDRYAYDVSPVSDNAPFFWHFARFGDLVSSGDPALRRPIGPEDGRGERVLLVMLALAVLFSAVFLMLPFAFIRKRWGELPRKGTSVLYFAALGLGFMCFEITLLQKLTLFLGYPTYTLTVTLFALLVFSGIGSLTTGSYLHARNRALPLLLGALLALTLFLTTGLDPLVEVLVGQALPLRIAAAVLVLAPLGLCLGAFMPLGLATVSRLTPYRAEYVAWSWAVNGMFSVIGSLLATMLSMSYGFRAVLLLAVLLYASAAVALRAIPLRAPEAS